MHTLNTIHYTLNRRRLALNRRWLALTDGGWHSTDGGWRPTDDTGVPWSCDAMPTLFCAEEHPANLHRRGNTSCERCPCRQWQRTPRGQQQHLHIEGPLYPSRSTFAHWGGGSRPLLSDTGGGGGSNWPPGILADPPTHPHQKIFPQEKNEIYQTWRWILGTQTFFWPLTPPPGIVSTSH